MDRDRNWNRGMWLIIIKVLTQLTTNSIQTWCETINEDSNTVHYVQGEVVSRELVG